MTIKAASSQDMRELAERVQAVRDRRMKIDGAPWSYLKSCQWIMGKSRGGCNKDMSEYRVADIRGWGHLQYMGIQRGDQVAQDMQDANGIFIASAPTDIDTLLSALDQAAAQRKGLVTQEMIDRAVKAIHAYDRRIVVDRWAIREALTAALHPEGKSETSEIEADMIAAGAGGFK